MKSMVCRTLVLVFAAMVPFVCAASVDDTDTQYVKYQLTKYYVKEYVSAIQSYGLAAYYVVDKCYSITEGTPDGPAMLDVLIEAKVVVRQSIEASEITDMAFESLDKKINEEGASIAEIQAQLVSTIDLFDKFRDLLLDGDSYLGSAVEKARKYSDEEIFIPETPYIVLHWDEIERELDKLS